MAAKKPSAQAAAKQPEASKPAEKPEDQTTASSAGEKSVKAPGAPETKPEGGSGEQGKERGPAKDGNLSEDPDKESPEGEITLEVVTRLERRIRGGVIVTREPRTVSVTEEVAELIEADPHISATRK
jgi:hypothetical protein